MKAYLIVLRTASHYAYRFWRQESLERIDEARATGVVVGRSKNFEAWLLDRASLKSLP